MTSVWNSNIFGEECDWVCKPKDVGETEKTLMHFQQGLASGSSFKTYDTHIGKLYVWEHIKPRFIAYFEKSIKHSHTSEPLRTLQRVIAEKYNPPTRTKSMGSPLFAAMDGDRTLFYLEGYDGYFI